MKTDDSSSIIPSSLKATYWQEGYMFRTRNNGYVIVIGDSAINDGGNFTFDDLDDDMYQNTILSDGKRVDSSDVMAVFEPREGVEIDMSKIKYDALYVRKHFEMIWQRK